MAITQRNGIYGKICSGCNIWKPITDFPDDRTHGSAQGYKHCRCKDCHRLAAKISRLVNKIIHTLNKSPSVIPSQQDFKNALTLILWISTLLGRRKIVVNAGVLHRAFGGYPNRNIQRMPACCSAMKKAMKLGDMIVSKPPKGKGASLTIKYMLPRIYSHALS